MGVPRLLTVPFALGMDESFASRELPEGALRECINVRQRRLHAFGVRPDYPAVSMGEFGGTLTPYMLYSLNDRLLCIGDRQGQGRPTDIFDFVQDPGGTWKGTIPPGASSTSRVPSITGMRNVGLPPEGAASIVRGGVAAVNGHVCLVYGVTGAAGAQAGYVHIFRSDTDTSLVFTTVALSNIRVVAAGNSFWVLGVDAANDLIGLRYDTTSSTALAAPATLYTGTVSANTFASASVGRGGLSYQQFVVFIRDGSTTVIRRFNEAGAQQASFAGPAVAPVVVAIAADSVSNHIVIAHRLSSGDAQVQTFNLATNASIVGPTAFFGANVIGELSLVFTTVANIAELSTDAVLRATFTTTTHARTIKTIEGYSTNGAGCETLAGFALQPVTCGDDNQLLILERDGGGTAGGNFRLGVCADQGIGTDGGVGALGEGGGCQVCVDLSVSPPLYYWSRLVIGTDGQRVPLVSQLQVDSLLQRQACQLGNGLFITGGMPLYHDGRQLSECGFPERPRFNGNVSLTAGGLLLGGADYDYCFIWRWVDSLGQKAQSPVSAIQFVTTTTANRTVLQGCYPPHTLRRDALTGSTAILELYRTQANLVSTTAVIVSSRDFSTTPAIDGDFNGITLQLSINGGGTQTVTFSATDNTLSDIIAAINTQTTLCTVSISDSGNSFKIVSDTAGSGGSVAVVGGTGTALGLGFVGLFVGQSSSGTSTFTKSTVFQLAATAAVPVTGNFGAPVTITDNTSDAALLSKPPLYTNAEHGALSGILEHEAPPACDFAWGVGERVFIGGLADRSEVRISNRLFPGEGPSFSGSPEFRARVEGDVTAVAALDGTPVAFTSDSLYIFSRELPNDNSSAGALGPPRRLPTEGGCNNANSIVETSLGLFYEARDGKLMLLPRGSGVPVWIGKKVQDSLEAFPVITGAVYVDIDHVVVFTCTNNARTASVILVFDLLIQQWYKDTFSIAQSIRSAAPFQGRLAYIDTATVRLQSLSLVPAAFIPMSVKTGALNPFKGNGWGRMPSIVCAGEFRGNCRLRLSISYDDGRVFVVCKTFDELTAAGLLAGDSFQETWFPARVKGDSYVLLWEVLPDLSNTPSEGLILNCWSVELEGASPSRVRSGSAHRG